MSNISCINIRKIMWRRSSRICVFPTGSRKRRKIFPRMKSFIKTYGCQMNEQDSLQIKGLLSRMGYADTPDPEEADLILVVTCSIREKAVHKVYSELGRLKPLIEKNPNRIIGLAGCVAQQEKENLLRRFPYLDLVFGPDAIGRLPDMVQTVFRNRRLKYKKPIVQTCFSSRKDFEFVDLVI